MVSTLIWRNVILLYVVKSNILWLTFKLSYHYRCNILCTVSFLLYIATKKLKQNHYCKQFYECSYHKKITLARFACYVLENSSDNFRKICWKIPCVPSQNFVDFLEGLAYSGKFHSFRRCRKIRNFCKLGWKLRPHRANEFVEFKNELMSIVNLAAFVIFAILLGSSFPPFD